MVRATRGLILFCLAVLISAPAAAVAQPVFGVGRVIGKRSARPKTLSKSLRKALKAEGRVIKLRKGTVKSARKKRVDYLVTVKITRRKRKHSAYAQLIRVEDRKVLKKMRRSYRKSKLASKTGRLIGEALAAIAVEDAGDEAFDDASASENDDESMLDENIDDGGPALGGPVVPAGPPPSPDGATSSGLASNMSDSSEGSAVGGFAIDEKDDSEQMEVEVPRRRRKAAEDKLVQLRAALGTQMASAYTVAVGDEITGLAYSLRPLMMLGGGLTFNAFDTGIVGSLDLFWSPVEYLVDVEPAVTPNNPSGSFLSVQTTAGYRLRLLRLGRGRTSGLYLTPMLGITYNSLSVQSQGDNSVVLSWGALNGQLGALGSLRLSDALIFDMDLRGGLVLSYSESPRTTGDGGGGLNLVAGLTGRYWFSRTFGAYVRVAYEYQRVGLSGTGNRVPFRDDPVLNDATIFSADFKTALGFTVAL